MKYQYLSPLVERMLATTLTSHLFQVDDGLLLECVQLEGEVVRQPQLERFEPLIKVRHAAGYRPLRIARLPAGSIK